jgi:hypothetical protein
MMMKTVLLTLALAALPLFADECPMHAGHVMGFSQEKTTHKFVIDDEGGAIEVRANDAADSESVSAIRSHLQHIAKAFAAGDFSKPLGVHGRMPDGADTMKSLRSKIAYRYEEIDRGARVSIVTTDADARAAVREFLEFQKREHHTE